MKLKSNIIDNNELNELAVAILDNAVDVLENNAYIKSTSYKREIFKVTKKEYDYFDEQFIYV